MQQQRRFSSVEEEETKKNDDDDNNNPLGFKFIKKFDSNGKFITSWGSEGTCDGQFWLPHGIAIDSSDNMYVVDSGNVHKKRIFVLYSRYFCLLCILLILETIFADFN